MLSIERIRTLLSGDAGNEDGDDEADRPSLIERCREVATNPETVTTDDGRQLGYADCGDPDGDPLLVFHGFPNSRVFGAIFDEPGREEGVRILAPERPGIGVSDPKPDRTLGDWPDDVAALLDELGIDAAPVLGISGGGPYALACAALAPERTERAGVGVGLAPVSSVSVRDRLPFLLARYASPLVAYQLRRDGERARADPEAYLRERAAEAAPIDEEYWLGEVGGALLLSGVEARRHHGNAGLVRELALYGRPWDFDLSSIGVPTYLWYGRADRIVPVEMGHYLAKTVPTAEAHFYPEYGHVSTVERNREAVLSALLGR
jgi:pimeloyl-ACP methyl ester carboxylesterase